MPFTVPIYVHPAAAIQAGLATIGDQEVIVSEAALAELTPEERLELSAALLAKHRVGAGAFEVDGVKATDLEACAPTFEELQRLLTHRALQRERRADARTELAIQDRATALRAQEEASVRKHEEDRRGVQRAKAVQKWVEAHGDENQQARFKEGLLPEPEALESIHEQVFDDFENNERYSKIRVEDVCTCPCADDVERVNVPADALTADQYTCLTEFRENAPKGTKVEARRHAGHCPSCDCDPVVRYSAELTLEWNGFTLTREYLL